MFFVWWLVCEQDYTQTTEGISIKLTQMVGLGLE